MMKSTAKTSHKLLGILVVAVALLGGWKLLPLPCNTADSTAGIGPESATADPAYEILEPESWVGKPLPILEFINIRDQLTDGNWLILLYHGDCPDCVEAIARCEQMARDLAGEEDFLRLALIEVPPYGDAPTGDNSSCTVGQLVEAKVWFVTTPVVALLRNSLVRDVWEGMPDIGVIIESVPH